jgi:magnesium-transporting ATPase (P-type)
MENFDDRINQILLGAAVVSIAIGLYKEGFPYGLIEGTSIAISLVIIVSVTSVNNYYSEKRLADLLALSEKLEVQVYRNSDKAITVDSEELVVGDLIEFKQGDKMPADVIMIEGQDVITEESELTGESESFPKEPVDLINYQNGACCTILGKCLVQSGVGKAIVMAVGYSTVSGVISATT